MLDHQSFNFVYLTRIKTIVRSQLNRIKPEFSFIARRPYVYMRRFITFIAEKEKAISANSKDDRHL